MDVDSNLVDMELTMEEGGLPDMRRRPRRRDPLTPPPPYGSRFETPSGAAGGLRGGPTSTPRPEAYYRDSPPRNDRGRRHVSFEDEGHYQPRIGPTWMDANAREAFKNMKLEPYNGKGDWAAWEAKMIVCLGAKYLTGEAAVHFVLMHLTESVLVRVPDYLQDEMDFQIFLQGIRRLMRPKGRMETARAELKAFTQRKGESYGELGERLLTLIRQAYPGGDMPTDGPWVAEKYVEAVADGPVRCRLREAGDHDLERVIIGAERLAAAARVEALRGKARGVSYAEDTSEIPAPQAAVASAPQSKDGDWQAQIKALTKQVEDLGRQLRGRDQIERRQESAGRRPRRERDMSNVTCWGCGHKGHVQRRCPNGQSRRPAADTRASPTAAPVAAVPGMPWGYPPWYPMAGQLPQPWVAAPPSEAATQPPPSNSQRS